MYTPSFARGGLLFCQLCLLLVSFYFASTLAHRVASLFLFRIMNFVWEQGSSHQILLSRLQNRSEFYIKTRATFGEVHCENQAAGRIKKNERGRAQALPYSEGNIGFSASTSADRVRFLGIFLPVRELRLVQS